MNCYETIIVVTLLLFFPYNKTYITFNYIFKLDSLHIGDVIRYIILKSSFVYNTHLKYIHILCKKYNKMQIRYL